VGMLCTIMKGGWGQVVRLCGKGGRFLLVKGGGEWLAQVFQ
jgi:hypothetical protein